MVLAIIMVTLGIVLFAAGFSIVIMAYDGAEAFGGFVLIVIGCIVFFGGKALGDALDKPDNSIDICAEKGGLVNDDGLCIVKGKPVEYSKGVWRQ